MKKLRYQQCEYLQKRLDKFDSIIQYFYSQQNLHNDKTQQTSKIQQQSSTPRMFNAPKSKGKTNEKQKKEQKTYKLFDPGFEKQAKFVNYLGRQPEQCSLWECKRPETAKGQMYYSYIGNYQQNLQYTPKISVQKKVNNVHKIMNSYQNYKLNRQPLQQIHRNETSQKDQKQDFNHMYEYSCQQHYHNNIIYGSSQQLFQNTITQSKIMDKEQSILCLDGRIQGILEKYKSTKSLQTIPYSYYRCKYSDLLVENTSEKQGCDYVSKLNSEKSSQKEQKADELNKKQVNKEKEYKKYDKQSDKQVNKNLNQKVFQLIQISSPSKMKIDLNTRIKQQRQTKKPNDHNDKVEKINLDQSIQQLNRRIKQGEKFKQTNQIPFIPFIYSQNRLKLNNKESNKQLSLSSNFQSNFSSIYQQKIVPKISFEKKSKKNQNQKKHQKKENSAIKNIETILNGEKSFYSQSNLAFFNGLKMDSNIVPNSFSTIEQIDFSTLDNYSTLKDPSISFKDTSNVSTNTLHHYNYNLTSKVKENQQKNKYCQTIMKQISKHQNEEINNCKSFQYYQGIQQFSKLNQRQQFLNKNEICLQVQISKKSISNQRVLNKSILLKKKTKHIKNQCQRLVCQLLKQIQLDKKLRLAKFAFQNLPQQSKWTILRNKYLNQKLFSSSLESKTSLWKFWTVPKIKSLFGLTLEQHDPFFSVYQENQTVNIRNIQLTQKVAKQIIEAYFQVEIHFKSKVLYNFDSQQLLRTGFTPTKLSIQGSQQIHIEDLVRFLNMKVDCSYRKRDFILLYRRLLKMNEKQKSPQTFSATTKIQNKKQQVLKIQNQKTISIQNQQTTTNLTPRSLVYKSENMSINFKDLLAMLDKQKKHISKIFQIKIQ